jgi:hypothetical protein
VLGREPARDDRDFRGTQKAGSSAVDENVTTRTPDSDRPNTWTGTV